MKHPFFIFVGVSLPNFAGIFIINANTSTEGQFSFITSDGAQSICQILCQLALDDPAEADLP